MPYIWEHSRWPDFFWQPEDLIRAHGNVRFRQGAILEKIKSLGFDLHRHAHADIITEEVVNTSAIEGETFSPDSVRSSVGNKLGLPLAGLQYTPDKKIDGMVEVLLNATLKYDLPLTRERLWGWQAALFPTGYSGIVPITTGAFRKDQETPMQIVSGPFGRERVHFQAPPADILDREMAAFLTWFNSDKSTDGLFKAAIAHLWFVTLHPFDDGNGRIARAISDMVLSMDEQNPQRFYSLSAHIMSDRAAYYQILEKTQKGSLDITPWLQWFFSAVDAAIVRSEALLGNTMAKARFWKHFMAVDFNARQKKVLNRLLYAGPAGFEGPMNNRKYVGMTHTSRATAQRELADLANKGALTRLPGGGRSTGFEIEWPRWLRILNSNL